MHDKMANNRKRDFVKLTIKTLGILVLFWGLVINAYMLFFVLPRAYKDTLFLILALFLFGGIGGYYIWAGYSVLKRITKRSLNHLSACLAFLLLLALGAICKLFEVNFGEKGSIIINGLLVILCLAVTFLVWLFICKAFDIMYRKVKQQKFLTAE